MGETNQIAEKKTGRESAVSQETMVMLLKLQVIECQGVLETLGQGEAEDSLAKDERQQL